MRIGGMGFVGFAALWLAACGGEGKSADAVPVDQGEQAEAPRQADASAAPRRERAGAASAAAQAPEPTAADSAAAAREDVSPEWKMNERKMAPYSDCMAKARDAPADIRVRLEAACGNLPDAPR
jgi:hypothetical protein